MASSVIMVPAFATSQDGVYHFFGTRRAPLLPLSATAGTVVPETVSGLPALLISVKQVHGTDVLVLDRPVAKAEWFDGGWDALLTNQPRVLLIVRTADCVPVLIQDPERQVAGAIHAGWRGTVAGVVPQTIERMVHRFGSNPKAIRVVIGPSIGPCCYEVDAPVLDQVRAMAVPWREAVEDRGSGKAMLNLRTLIRAQAHEAGVPFESVQTVDLCTACHLDLFYSYRREGTVLGTMVSGIMLMGSVTQRQQPASA